MKHRGIVVGALAALGIVGGGYALMQRRKKKARLAKYAKAAKVIRRLQQDREKVFLR